MDNEPIISHIKGMMHEYRRTYDKSPKFLVCNYDTKMELLASTWSPHFLDRDKNNNTTFMGMVIAITETNAKVLEVC